MGLLYINHISVREVAAGVTLDTCLQTACGCSRLHVIYLYKSTPDCAHHSDVIVLHLQYIPSDLIVLHLQYIQLQYISILFHRF